MNNYKTLNPLLVAALIVGLVAVPAVASPMDDNFNISHDFLASGVTGTAWDGLLNGGNASTLNANATNAGQLTITTNGTTTAWDGNGQSGPFLYQNVIGDFIATVMVTGGDAANFNVASLLARDPSAGSVIDENFFSANYNFFGTTPGVQRRNVNKGSTTKFDTATVAASTPVLLQLERAGDDFTASYSTDGGVSFIDIGAAITKTDMPETLQIGLAAANYGANSFSVVFDDFTIVPEPASVGLMMLGSLMLLARRR